MTASRDPDRLIHEFLFEGEEQLQDQVYDAVRAEIEQKRQRAGFGLWRTPTMNKFLAIGLGAAAVVVALFVGSQVFSSPNANIGGPGADPTPTATAEPTPEPTPTPSAEAGLPQGPFVVDDPLAPDGAPSITVTIPSSGWSHDPEVAAIGKGDDVANLPEAAILLWTNAPGTGFYVPGDPCMVTSTRPDTPATTVEDIVAALAAQASRDASEPVDVTVGGYAGKSITLHVPDDAAFDECEEGEFVSYGTEEDPWAATTRARVRSMSSGSWTSTAPSWSSTRCTVPTRRPARGRAASHRRVGHLRGALTDRDPNRSRGPTGPPAISSRSRPDPAVCNGLSPLVVLAAAQNEPIGCPGNSHVRSRSDRA